MLTRIYSAIHDREILEISYRGQGLRKIEPRQLEVVQDGRAFLYAYQTDGFSRTGLTWGWKVFAVEAITHVRGTDSHFEPERPDPTQDEARELIARWMKQGVPHDEIVTVLERAGAPRSWIRGLIREWRASEEGVRPRE
jgi:hypothetical protein